MTTQTIKGRTHHHNQRRGAVALVTMLCLLLILLVAAALTKHAFLRRLSQARAADRAQAFWLAESGLERAVARMALDSNYRGETWTVSHPPRRRGRSGGALGVPVVEIQVGEPTDGVRVIRATAEWPVLATDRIKVTRERPWTRSTNQVQTGDPR